jgi:hypothetical protein
MNIFDSLAIGKDRRQSLTAKLPEFDDDLSQCLKSFSGLQPRS